jgi:hypothetical protein
MWGGAEIVVMADQKFDSASFNAGWDAAIQEVSSICVIP